MAEAYFAGVAPEAPEDDPDNTPDPDGGDDTGGDDELKSALADTVAAFGLITAAS